MRANNEKRPRINFADKRKIESGGHRDGNRNENRTNSNNTYNERRNDTERPRSRFSTNGERNGNSYERNENRNHPYRPYSANGENPRNNYSRKPYSSDNTDERNQRSYSRKPYASDNDGERRQNGYSRKPSYGGDRQRSFGNNERYDNDRRPYKRPYNSEGNYRQGSNSIYSKKKQIEYKKQYVDLSQPMRLNKFIANAGLCSRREADEYIAAGVVSVNGTVIIELGTKIIPDTDRVLFHDQLVRSEKKVYLLLNKPKNCVTTSDDPQERLTVMDLVKDACPERVYPVGRLDRNTTGVLLITNDGDLASKMMHPKYNRKKIYEVALDKDLEPSDMEKIKNGITLEDGEVHADNIEYSKENMFNQVGVEIHSGKNRIIRRIFEHLGYKVIRLDRVYLAGLTKKNLPRGKWRFLSETEVNILKMS